MSRFGVVGLSPDEMYDIFHYSFPSFDLFVVFFPVCNFLGALRRFVVIMLKTIRTISLRLALFLVPQKLQCGGCGCRPGCSRGFSPAPLLSSLLSIRI